MTPGVLVSGEAAHLMRHIRYSKSDQRPCCVQAVASEAQCTFFSLSPSQATSKYEGDGAKAICSLFAQARLHSPAVIFLDKVDALFGQRCHDEENGASRQVKTQLLLQMQSASQQPGRVMVLAAANRPFDLDPALRRRFQKVLPPALL
jgi:SpoVK/Ycf46/Vps4 family AAA+-type ATPase